MLGCGSAWPPVAGWAAVWAERLVFCLASRAAVELVDGWAAR